MLHLTMRERRKRRERERKRRREKELKRRKAERKTEPCTSEMIRLSSFVDGK